ncbi:MAG: CDP-alcohol phosphatidyltransferase family protein, partial [Methylococcaceae bacterium]|nr:CDP-alcohol phosphatidyltransferase family protein [Methylococcaceae bacterium]
SAAEWYFTPNHYAILVALVIINLGCCVTLYRRTLTAYRFMERHDRA